MCLEGTLAAWRAELSVLLVHPSHYATSPTVGGFDLLGEACCLQSVQSSDRLGLRDIHTLQSMVLEVGT